MWIDWLITVAKRRTIGSIFMIFGRPHSQALTVVLLLFLLGSGALAAVDVPTVPWTVDALVALLKEQREPSMAFEEATYSSLLTEPLKVRGLLRFTPPATMEKAITEPFRERYVIEGDRVLFESERKGIKRTISLEDYPALRSFVDAFRASFTGDAARLQKVYDVTLEGTRRQWTLLLRPREVAGRSMVDYILFTGSEGRVATIAVRLPDGDRSVMTLLREPTR
jgi:hypothetical protein